MCLYQVQAARSTYIHTRNFDGGIDTIRVEMHAFGGDEWHDDSSLSGLLLNDVYDAVFDSLQFRRWNIVLDVYGGVHIAGVDTGIAVRGDI